MIVGLYDFNACFVICTYIYYSLPYAVNINSYLIGTQYEHTILNFLLSTTSIVCNITLTFLDHGKPY